MTDAAPALHLLLVANETVGEQTLLDTLRGRGDDLHVTVVAPVNQPRRGYVVYADTRRASAHRRLERALEHLRAAGISAEGYVVAADPVAAVRDALAQLEPAVDAILVSTHPEEKSGWLRRNVVDRIRSASGEIPVEHLIAHVRGPNDANVLVIANETVLSAELLERIRARAKEGKAAFLIVAPQGDQEDHAVADRRLRRALTELRGEGINAHGQIVHPDPYTAAMNAVHDERVDEIVVSTFPGEKSGWLRRDLVSRLRKDTGRPVDHVVSSVRQEVIA